MKLYKSHNKIYNMKKVVISVQTKEPNTYELNEYGLKGWKLDAVKDIHNKGIYSHTEYHYSKILQNDLSLQQIKTYNPIKVSNRTFSGFKIFGLRFELWKVIQGYRLSVDTKTTRYIFKPFWYTGKCKVADLI